MENMELSIVYGIFDGLTLLYDVPMSYVIPDESLLPPESMRFFVLDDNFINALCDGFQSIGRLTKSDLENDKTTRDELIGNAKKNHRNVRLGKIHPNHKATYQNTMSDVAPDERSGFLIRSVAVRMLKGLEVAGADKSGNNLLLVRFDRISSDILIAVFEGIVDTITISEPKNAIRFGSDDENRKVTGRSVANLGEPCGEFSIVIEGNGRIDIAATAANMKAALGADITPSVFAYEMMRVPQKAVFSAGGADK